MDAEKGSSYLAWVSGGKISAVTNNYRLAASNIKLVTFWPSLFGASCQDVYDHEGAFIQGFPWR